MSSIITLDTFEGTNEARAFLELLDEFISRRGYPNALGVLIVPLMEDGFGVLGAMRGEHRMSREEAFEYLRACADHLAEL